MLPFIVQINTFAAAVETTTGRRVAEWHGIGNTKIYSHDCNLCLLRNGRIETMNTMQNFISASAFEFYLFLFYLFLPPPSIA